VTTNGPRIREIYGDAFSTAASESRDDDRNSHNGFRQDCRIHKMTAVRFCQSCNLVLLFCLFEREGRDQIHHYERARG